MITRAQAEALLNLAEALETCERVNAGATANVGEDVLRGSGWGSREQMTAIQLRLAISEAVPKSIGS